MSFSWFYVNSDIPTSVVDDVGALVTQALDKIRKQETGNSLCRFEAEFYDRDSCNEGDKDLSLLFKKKIFVNYEVEAPGPYSALWAMIDSLGGFRKLFLYRPAIHPESPGVRTGTMKLFDDLSRYNLIYNERRDNWWLTCLHVYPRECAVMWIEAHVVTFEKSTRIVRYDPDRPMSTSRPPYERNPKMIDARDYNKIERTLCALPGATAKELKKIEGKTGDDAKASLEALWF